MTIRNSRLAMHHLRTKIAAPAFVAALAFGASVAQAEVTVTTGSGYIPMVKALVAAYQTETGAKVGTAFGGNIGQMLAQTASGSGVNVVVSDRASLAKFKMLDKQEVVLGTTPIVLIWRKGLTLSAPEDLAKAEIERIAYPDPKAAVYGRATEDFLKTSGLGAKLEGKTNIVSAVPQVTAYVAKGEMDAGFVNRLAAKAQKAKLGGSLEITDRHQPIVMIARPVEGAAKADDVRAFLDWLSGESAKKILRENGID